MYLVIADPSSSDLVRIAQDGTSTALISSFPERIDGRSLAFTDDGRYTDEAATRKMYAESAGSSIEPRRRVSGDLASVSDVIGLIHDAQNSGRLHYEVGS